MQNAGLSSSLPSPGASNIYGSGIHTTRAASIPQGTGENPSPPSPEGVQNLVNNPLVSLMFESLMKGQKNLAILYQNQDINMPHSVGKQQEFVMEDGNRIVNDKNGDDSLMKTHQQNMDNQKPFVLSTKEGALDNDLVSARELMQQQSLEFLQSLHSPKTPERQSRRNGELVDLTSHLHHLGNVNQETPRSPLQHVKGYYAEHPGMPQQKSTHKESQSRDSTSFHFSEVSTEDSIKSEGSTFFKIMARCIIGGLIAISAAFVLVTWW